MEEDLMTFHLMHQMLKNALEGGGGDHPRKLKFAFKKTNKVKELLHQIILVNDQNKSLEIWLSEYLADLLMTRALTTFNMQVFV